MLLTSFFPSATWIPLSQLPGRLPCILVIFTYLFIYSTSVCWCAGASVCQHAGLLKGPAFTVILLWSSRCPYASSVSSFELGLCHLCIIIIVRRSSPGVWLPLLSEVVSWWSSFDSLTSRWEQLRVFLGPSPAPFAIPVGFAHCCAIIDSPISILSWVVPNSWDVLFPPQKGCYHLPFIHRAFDDELQTCPSKHSSLWPVAFIMADSLAWHSLSSISLIFRWAKANYPAWETET